MCYVDSCGYVRFVNTNDVACLYKVLRPSATLSHVTCGCLQPSAVKRISYQRGYVSRRDFHALNEPVHYSQRLKLFYILAPSYCSSRYCHRVYLDPVIFDDSFALESATLR